MSEKVEFASPAWVDAARECIEELAKAQDLSAVSVSFCEEFTDPPAHLCPTGGSIGWHLIVSEGKVEVAAGVVDADLTIIADYTKRSHSRARPTPRSRPIPRSQRRLRSSGVRVTSPRWRR